MIVLRIDNRAHLSLSHLPADVVPDSGPAHLLESCPPGSGALGLSTWNIPRRLKAIG